MNSSPWAKFTTSMMPKIKVRPEATSARIRPVTMPLTVWISSRSNGKFWKYWTTGSISHSQILLDERVVDFDVGGGASVPDGALLHDVDALARFQRQRHVLLDQEDRDALLVQHVDDIADLRHHPRHQALGRLVEQNDLRLQHHGAR